MELKEIYKKVSSDIYPKKMEISLYDEQDKKQTFLYEKVNWTVDGESRGLRYGDNPCQKAAFYKLINGNLVIGDVEILGAKNYLLSDATLLKFGKHPSKTNFTDVDNALNILRYLMDKPTAVIVKHNNPCGVAESDTIFKAYEKAYEADITAAFGGCIVFNRPVDKETAKAISMQYAEVVAAPDFEEGTVEILEKRKNLRILKIKNIENLKKFAGKKVLDFKALMDGSIIIQTSFDLKALTSDKLHIAKCNYKDKEYKIDREPTLKEYEDMLFGWKIEAGITSNSVIYVKDGVTLGIGTGEQDRVGVAEIAVYKAYEKMRDKYSHKKFNTPYRLLQDEDKRDEIENSVKEQNGGLKNATMVSDAFFPFRDGVDVGLKEGVSAIIQTGGSINDYQAIEACNEFGATMVYTGQRSFKH